MSWAKAGEEFELYVELAANGMFGVGLGGDINPVDPNKHYELLQCELAVFHRDAWDLLWDFTVIAEMAKELPEGDPRAAQALFVANSIQNAVWTDDRASIARGRHLAAAFLSESNGPHWFTVSATGHAHIDTAWLWPYAETRRKVARSFASQLALIERYPFHKFSASQAQQYEWLKEDYPVLFGRVQEAARHGSFVPIGGTWVEMDCNLPSGESFCRQFLMGQRFFREHFGRYCNEFWLPDTFGYSAQLPQIIRGSGIQYFMTQKLSWNLINKFPHHTFHWEGLDGTSVLTHFPPADTYCSSVSVKDLLYSVSNFKDQERSEDVMLLYGWGDGGGGPDAPMLERLQRCRDLRGLPRVEVRAPPDFFPRMEARARPLLKWSGELYFELHRGTYTSQAKTKLGNRSCEVLLRETELWACAAGLAAYPAAELARLWKLLLLNQFHDVLPGSSITQVYIDAAAHYADIRRSGTALLQQALAELAAADGSGKRTKTERADGQRGHRVYNSLGWARSELLPGGRRVRVPPMSFAYPEPEEPANGAAPIARPQQSGGWVLENEHLRASVSAAGRLTSLVHKASGREALRTEGNVFMMYDDVNLFWDAWDAEVFHLEKGRAVPAEAGVAQLESNSPQRAVLRVAVRISERSNLVQRIVLVQGAARLDFATEVDWDENRRFLKVEFPTTVFNAQATFETQFGHLQRPTHRNTSWDWAKFEVCAHKWADVSEYGFGVALLNDCKYGHAVEGGVMRLSLLRSPKAPDASCDIGHHAFVYSLMPHAGSFQDAGVIQEAYNLNVPLVMAPAESAVCPSAPPLVEVSHPGVIVETVKRAEEAGEQAVVVRLYEAYGGTHTVAIRTSLPHRRVEAVNILEEPVPGDAWRLRVEQSGAITATFSPFRILTLKYTL